MMGVVGVIQDFGVVVVVNPGSDGPLTWNIS